MPTAGRPDDATIREQAYYFWEQDGRPEGRDTEYWTWAEVAAAGKAQLDTLTQPAPKQARTKAAATKSKTEPAKAEKPGKKKPKAK